ncbi:MAG: CHAD domain-containing protein [Gemmatimonadota bacterium]|nr:MAG: CHAD domain-containing protein [Gemmatimonadota bacterium]
MARVTPEQLDLPAEETARVLSLAWLDEAEAALERLPEPEDGEALHDFRVSLRRFRSCVRAYQPYLRGSAPKKARREIGALASATNAGRDAEVQVIWLEGQADKLIEKEQAGLGWLLDQLRALRDQAYAEAQLQITKDFRKAKRRVAKRFSSYERSVGSGDPVGSRSFVDVTGELVEKHASELRDLLATVHTPQDEDQAHNSRIAAKRLRYIVEPLAKVVDGTKNLIKDLKGLQDILGELHDTHVLADEIASAIEIVAAERARSLHEQALEHDVASETRLDERLDNDPTLGLLALTKLLRERRDRLFEDLQQSWLGERADGFFDKVAELAARLRHARDSETEIERKYLLTAVPDSLANDSAVSIEQGWIRGKLIQERLRRVRSKTGTRHYRTVKSGSGLRRVQLEEPISRRTFQSLWPLTEGRRLRKKRYRLVDGDLTWEIDDFADRDLVLAEVELPAEDHRFELPAWLQPFVKREVTGDPRYENVNLVRRTPRRRIAGARPAKGRSKPG